MKFENGKPQRIVLTAHEASVLLDCWRSWRQAVRRDCPECPEAQDYRMAVFLDNLCKSEDEGIQALGAEYSEREDVGLQLESLLHDNPVIGIF